MTSEWGTEVLPGIYMSRRERPADTEGVGGSAAGALSAEELRDRLVEARTKYRRIARSNCRMVHYLAELVAQRDGAIAGRDEPSDSEEPRILERANNGGSAGDAPDHMVSELDDDINLVRESILSNSDLLTALKRELAALLGRMGAGPCATEAFMRDLEVARGRSKKSCGNDGGKDVPRDGTGSGELHNYFDFDFDDSESVSSDTDDTTEPITEGSEYQGEVDVDMQDDEGNIYSMADMMNYSKDKSYSSKHPDSTFSL